MNSSVQKIMADLRAGKASPIYLLTGDENYYIDLVSDYIEKHFLPEHERAFNQTVLYGLTTSAQELISTVKRFPMMAEHQVVILKEAQMMKELDKTEVLFTHPVSTTILVICYKHKKLDKRTAFYKAVAKSSLILDTEKIKDNQVSGWIADYCKDHGIKISHAARELLASHIGSDLEKITNALDKLAVVVSKEEEITPSHIEKNIGISKDYNIYELQNALSIRDVKKTYEIVKYISENQKTHNNILMITLLNTFFSKVYQYHFVADKNKAAAEMKVAPFQVQNYQKAAMQYPVQKLEAIFGYLCEADLKSKGVDYVSASEGGLLEELIYKILN